MNTATLNRHFGLKEFDNLWNSFLAPADEQKRGFSPALDVYETDNSFAVELIIPGMKKADINECS